MKKAKDQPESEPAELASLVGERIRKIRKEEGLSLELFALRCDMNAAYVGHIERGVQNPTLNTLERICKGLDISVEDLFIDMLFTDVQRSVRLNKKKKSTNTSHYPDEVIDRLARAFYPAIPACWNSEEGQRSLVGARPLHLAAQDRSVAQKPHWGFHCCAALRKRELAYGRRNRLITPSVKRNRAFPTGNALLYISLLSVAFGRVRPGGRTLSFYYDSSFSTRSIRYPTPTWVWIRCGASGHRSNFLRRDAM